MRLFENRLEAARELAGALAFLKSEKPLILTTRNEAVPIGIVVAETLEAPFDLLLVAKLAAPMPPHQIVGAVDEHGRISMIHTAARWHHLTNLEMIAPARTAFAELQQRRTRFRAVLPETDVRGRTVIIVDQGVETGATMLAAIASVRDRGAVKVVSAAPAGHGKATWQLHEAADVVVIPHTPAKFKGVEHFYRTYTEVPDHEVEAILQTWAASRPQDHPGVKILTLQLTGPEQQAIHCEIDLPPGTSRGSGPYPAVLFAHSLESDCRSPRLVPISRRLAKRGVIGMRIDFTGHGRTEGTVEQATDERMLGELRAAYENLQRLHEVDERRIGLSGSGSGGMLALRLAADAPEIAAMVIRGPVRGEEIEAASKVTCPTLIIHAQRDFAFEQAAQLLDRQLAATHQLLEIPDSSRQFNDPISRELMVSASVDWLVDHLGSDVTVSPQRQTTPP